jgi:phosphatidylglycerol:prolipoprotein diacylglycerol transferase
VIPYLNIPPLKIGPLEIHAFGVLVAIGILVGAWVVTRRAKERKLDLDVMRSAITWLLVGGFVMAHLVAVLAYEPERVLREPWSLLMFWSGLSSFGGFLGAFLGLYFYLRHKKVPMGPYFDCVGLGLIPGWIFGRLGCYTAHDHPGLATDFFLAVKYPPEHACHQSGPGAACHDLGFYELLFTLVLFVVFEFVRRRPPAPGKIAALIGFLYAPVRFTLDFLRTADARYLSLTPGQYFAIALFIGCGLFLWLGKSEALPAAPKAQRRSPRAS